MFYKSFFLNLPHEWGKMTQLISQIIQLANAGD